MRVTSLPLHHNADMAVPALQIRIEPVAEVDRRTDLEGLTASGLARVSANRISFPRSSGETPHAVVPPLLPYRKVCRFTV